jgi:hypothetical protein
MTSVVGTQRHPTFLGSDSAPDGITVQLRLREIDQRSRRRKNLVSCGGALSLMLLAMALTQHIVLQSRQPHTRSLGP